MLGTALTGTCNVPSAAENIVSLPEQMETGATRMLRPPLGCVILSDTIAIFV